MNRIQDKVVIVTGGASGIGRALSAELAEKGAQTIIVADIAEKEAKETAAAIRNTKTASESFGVDVSNERQINDLVDTVVSRYGRIDYMFNNAGIAICGEMRDIDLDQWQRVMNVNLWSVIYGTRAAYRIMVEQGYGHIVNTASLAGLIPEPMAAPYVTTKHAVVGLSTALRYEAAGLGINISAACPGMVKTNVFQSAEYAGVNRIEALNVMSSLKMLDVTKCARNIIKGVEKNRAVITDSATSKIYWWLYRLNPEIWTAIYRKMVDGMRELRSA